MKKMIYGAAAVLAVLSLGACCNKNDACKSKGMDMGDKLYTGVLPAADAAGIRYTLNLDYDEDHGNTRGDYDLLETYIMGGDTINATGYRDDKSFRSEGKFVVNQKDGKSIITLTQDVKDSTPGSAQTMNFLVESDSTIVMLNSDMEVSTTPGLNYTLKLVK